MAISYLWQLGKFLDKAIDIVPATKYINADDAFVEKGDGEAMK